MTEAESVFYARAAMVLIPVVLVTIAAIAWAIITNRQDRLPPAE